MNRTFWKLAYRGLIRNRRRTLLTAMAFVLGYIGLFLLGGYINRVEKVLRTQALYLNVNGHLKIQKLGAQNYWASPKKYQMTESQVNWLKTEILKMPEIEFVTEKLKVGAQISYQEKSFPVFIEGFEVESEKLARTHTEFKRWFQKFFDYEPRPFILAGTSYGISITPNLARLMGVIIENEKADLNFEAQLVGLDFEGSLNAIDVVVNKAHLTGSQFMRDLSVEMDITALKSLVNTSGATDLNIFLKNESDLSKVFVKIENLIAKQFPGQLEVKRFDTEEISPEYVGNMGILLVMMGFFIILIGGSVILSVLNVLTMSIYERSSEIGTLLSIGFSRFQVSSLFVLEGLILGLGGISLGGVLSVLLASLINQLKIPFQPPGALGTAFVHIDLGFMIGFGLAAIMLSLLVVASYLLTRKQTQKKLVQLLYEVEGKS